jgi:hypothetical protein
VFAFFSLEVGFLPPPPKLRHSGVYFARPDFHLSITLSVFCPTAGVGKAASPEDWKGVTLIGYNRPTAKADRRRLPGDET